MFKVFITRKIPQKGIDLLRNKGYEVEVAKQSGIIKRKELIKKIKEVDALLCLLTDKIDADIVNQAGPKLKIIANYAVGYDNLDIKAINAKGIMVTNTPGVLTETVAEHTLALMLAIARRVPEADKFVRAGKFKGWEPMMFLGNDLMGKVLGIIGLGRIGSRVAYHAVKGFDMKIFYTDPKRDENFEKEYGAVFKDIDSLLRESDFVSIHVPLLESTHHLINEARLKLMKPSAYLINTSRGPVVDELALIKALKEKWIKGAALDVFEFEPKISKGLMKLNNVVLTPHIASATEETRSKMSEIAAINIIEALEGRTPPNLISLPNSNI